MTTSRDLMIIAVDAESSRPVERGELSLALAGAEVIDLIEVGAVVLDDDRIVPGYRPTLADALLDQAASDLVRDVPYESVDDWLWRRGRGLSEAYRTAFEAEGLVGRRRRRGMPFGTGHVVTADSPDRRAATDRWASAEPVLVALAAALGIRAADAEETVDSAGVADDAVDTVLAAVHGSLLELAAIRQQRAIEQAAFDNIWRGQ
ncbi:GPP34 family phosphoprotein [Streptomyces sp. NPDC059165]|uniref:GOLPH3/VPS74 family protein n=1 Tax=Streptomyces sp. NPDC059165 TaxID=3346751 RepID=UPI003688FF5F